MALYKKDNGEMVISFFYTVNKLSSEDKGKKFLFYGKSLILIFLLKYFFAAQCIMFLINFMDISGVFSYYKYGLDNFSILFLCISLIIISCISFWFFVLAAFRFSMRDMHHYVAEIDIGQSVFMHGWMALMFFNCTIFSYEIISLDGFDYIIALAGICSLAFCILQMYLTILCLSHDK
jgi:hypothetical protein